MKKIAYTIDLVDDADLANEYCRLHADVWPEVRDGLRAVGVRELHIFRHVRRLFMLMEVADDFDPDTDFPAYLDTHPRCREWETLMDRFQAPLPEAREGEKWCSMESICGLE
ncbi:MAG: L-rhamnose mutarotase [Planctomycetota bacterium]|nr:L-rhamnose mutarotase [Planctomycetota bacterium]MEC8511574.1 L-rhamnose mutarotase [Planctomycetota bacterium]